MNDFRSQWLKFNTLAQISIPSPSKRNLDNMHDHHPPPIPSSHVSIKKLHLTITQKPCFPKGQVFPTQKLHFFSLFQREKDILRERETEKGVSSTMCNEDTSPLQHSSMIDRKPTLTLKPSRKTRSKTRKPKFLSLRLEVTQQSGEMTTTTISAATRRQLNLFPLHPETSSVEEKDTVAYFFDSADGGATTLSTLLGTGSSSEDDTTAVSLPSLTYAYGGQDSEEEGKLLVRTALRNKERDASEEKWVSYSEVVERKDEEVTSCAADLRCGARKMRGLSLKLDYQEILNAWCDKGPLYIQLESPQTVPDLHDDSSNHTKGPSRQIVSSGPSG
ncbi:hypothetical protein HYC85_002801 [Camellia sinensis]|uniref:Uncharacterized protein n=1 Tax=Camellia sinensis TaxID=4442 RepID=A0A7J7I9B9_CAMSI|nr:hypothetical protein HYC85_002801 [Camellia sinensis]